MSGQTDVCREFNQQKHHTMELKEFKSLLKSKNARWSIAPQFEDAAKTEEIFQPSPVGALPTKTTMPTAFMPKMRNNDPNKIAVWQPNMMALMRTAVKALPKTWDWRNVKGKNWITSVKNQGGCGSCVAFAATAAVEAHQRIETGDANLLLDLSESSLYFVNNRQCNAGDPNYGWWIPSALDSLVNEGICYELNYPYRAINQVAQFLDGSEKTFKIRGYDSTSNTTQMKRWLVEEGPLVTSFTVYNDFFGFFNAGTGVYTYTSGAKAGGHAVTVIGYDDTQSCWICKNSWGAKVTHPDGCFLIGYGECGIDSRMYVIQDVYDVITVDELPYNPNNLRIVYEGAKGWLLTDGVSRMKMFDNAEDARNGYCVARRHNRHGFVGRDNTRGAKRIDYITEYWTGSSGLPYMPLTKTDCIPYSPTNVLAEDLDAQGWRIKEGNHWMLLAHDMNDALAILKIVERHTKMCFIGRNNKRPDRKQYIMTYWE